MFIKVVNNIQKNLVLYYLLLSGLLVRLILANFPGFFVDTNTFFAWSLRVLETGFANFYSQDVWTSYTPGMIYLFYFLGILKTIFSLDSEQFYFLLKIPSILSDLVLSYLVYKQLLKTSGKNNAFLGLLFCLFNPVLIFNASIWGAFDGFMTLLLFLSIYYLNQRKLISSSIYFGLSILIKPQAIALIPVFGLFLLKNFSAKNILKLGLPALAIIIILSIPYFPNNPVFGIFDLVAKMSQDYKGNSLYAYNVWGSFGFWIDDSTILGFLPYRIWGILLFAVFWLYFYISFFKRKTDVYLLSALAFLFFFFLPTRVHERYLFSAFPFLILVSLQYKSKILLIFTALLSFMHLTNLYFVYVYYNEFYLHNPKLLYIPFFYEFLEKEGKFMSIISTLLFVLITITISRLILHKKHEF